MLYHTRRKIDIHIHNFKKIECIDDNIQDIFSVHIQNERVIQCVQLTYPLHNWQLFHFFLTDICQFYIFCASIRLILFVLSTNNLCAGENSHDSEMFHSHLDESCITVLHSLLVIVYKSDTVYNQCICVCVCVCVCVWYRVE